MSDKRCGTCHYFDPIFSPLHGWCLWFGVHRAALANLPQWVREADRTVWGNQDGKNCPVWEQET